MIVTNSSLVNPPFKTASYPTTQLLIPTLAVAFSTTSVNVVLDEKQYCLIPWNSTVTSYVPASSVDKSVTVLPVVLSSALNSNIVAGFKPSIGNLVDKLITPA